MNLKLDQGEAAFWAEYQNEPLPESSESGEVMSVDAVCAKTNGMKRGEVPAEVGHLTMFIDVQGSLLYWLVCGWAEDFTGYLIDYGTYPEQRSAYFTLRDARKTLAMVHKGTGQEGMIYAGLEALTHDRLNHVYTRDDGAEMRVERCLIDANWGASTDVIYQYCRQSGFRGTIMPSHGKYVGAAGRPFAELERKHGERAGLHWRVPLLKGTRVTRYVLIDTNFWKSFVHARLAATSLSRGVRGCRGSCPSH